MTHTSFNQLENWAKDRSWNKLLAKSEKFGGQTLLSHSRAVSGVAKTIIDHINLPEKFVGVVQIAGYLHDLGKESKEFQEAISSGSKPPAHLPSGDDVSSVLDEIGEFEDSFHALVYAVIVHTHLGVGEAVSLSRVVTEKVEGGDLPYISLLGTIVKCADWIASSPSPRDAYRSLERPDFDTLRNDHGIKFEYYSVQITRGVLTYLLHKGLQLAYKESDYTPLAMYPDGCLMIGKSDLDIQKISIDAESLIRKLLAEKLMEPSFLESATALQINRGMIANEGIVALSSMKTLAEFGANQVKGFSGKNDEQKRAIFVRFLSTLQNALRSNIVAIEIDEDKKNSALEDLAKTELELLGIPFGEIGLPMSYTTWTELIDQASSTLESNTFADRAIKTMNVEEGVDAFLKGYLVLVKRMKEIFKDPSFDPIKEISIGQYLTTLLADVKHPFLELASQKNTSNCSFDAYELAQRYYLTYRDAKPKAMGSMDGNIRCPICGSAAPGTTAIAAGVGSGTKKFMIMGIGTKRLDNVNVCELCLLEGILRGNKGWGYVLIPQMAFSIEESEAMEELAKKELRQLDRSPIKSSKLLLNGAFDQFPEKIDTLLEQICTAKRETFSISNDVIGNYVFMSTYPDSGTLNSDSIAKILLQGLILHLLLGVRVKIFSGLAMVDVTEKGGAVNFPANGSLMRTLSLREESIPFLHAEKIAKLLAAAVRAQHFANLSKVNGVVQALQTHPGQLAQRMLLKRDYPKLQDYEFTILLTLMEGRDMTTIADEIAGIMDEYYRPEKYGSSMHAILGPVNVLYNEFRRVKNLEDSSIQAIAGKMHRQLQQLNRGDYHYAEAAAPIMELCKNIADELEGLSPREQKNFLEDLRYSVYLLRLISINERIKAKKEESK
ncbi:MAG: hypothetical protein BAJATHORv1_130009 [Candidatus Thorarchaeota archaeon]|nr:MAG: hypothetical protein BAJATHORv1_130009 [Candidatus Thorarchaeota archaeon]